MSVLTTDRLRLVPLGPRHWPGLRDFYATERARFIGGPCGEGDAWRIFAADVEHRTLHGFGWWGVEVDGETAGQVGFWHPPHHEFLELGWTVFGGRGVAHEAAVAARERARPHLPPQPVTACIAHGNEASDRLARRLRAEPWIEAPRRERVTIWRHPEP